MKIDRSNYENIKIPMEVSGILEKTVLRKRKETARITAAIVMVFAVLLLTSNTPAAYAALLDVPVLGEAVKIFHIGSGGLISDGLQMGLATEEERLSLVFGKSADEYAAAVPAYKIEQFAAPDRIVITLHGIRSFDPATFIHEAEKCNFIKTAYREILPDDSAVRVVLELQPDISFEATEFKEPASLELRLFVQQKEERDIWFIRSRKMEMSEELALMPEMLPESDGVIAGTQDGHYIFCIGEFESEEEALHAFWEMDEEIRSEYSFSVDHCISSERPE